MPTDRRPLLSNYALAVNLGSALMIVTFLTLGSPHPGSAQVGEGSVGLSTGEMVDVLTEAVRHVAQNPDLLVGGEAGFVGLMATERMRTHLPGVAARVGWPACGDIHPRSCIGTEGTVLRLVGVDAAAAEGVEVVFASTTHDPQAVTVDYVELLKVWLAPVAERDGWEVIRSENLGMEGLPDPRGE